MTLKDGLNWAADPAFLGRAAGMSNNSHHEVCSSFFVLELCDVQVNCTAHVCRSLTYVLVARCLYGPICATKGFFFGPFLASAHLGHLSASCGPLFVPIRRWSL